MRVLIVEDDDALRELLVHRLSAENYAIDAVGDGQSGWDFLSTYNYDLLILDVGLPHLDGISLCQKLRMSGYTLPILMLTAHDSPVAKITGFDSGADDYVVKPFEEEELIARIRSLLRRGSANPLPILTSGALWLNSSTREVSYNGELLDLSAKEYALLELLLREGQHVFSKEEILDRLWSSSEFPVEATVRSHMRRLRHKLTAAGAPADLIATSHGRGYYLKGNDENSTNPDHSTTPVEAIEQVQTPPTVEAPDKKAQYLELLNQTWQNHQSRCLERVSELQSILNVLCERRLTIEEQADAYRIAHTLVGTLGTFGLQAAMQIARALEQEIHPDLYLDSSQTDDLLKQVEALWSEIESTQNLDSLPAQDSIGSSIQPPISDALQTDQPQPAPSLTVMLVDDDVILLQVLSKQLQYEGFEVITLGDPKQFWTVLVQAQPDAVILDVNMPNLSGLDLCQSLRAQPHWLKLPVLFLSVFADVQTQQKAFAVGADDYLQKPIDPQALGDRIRQRLARIRDLLS